MPPVTVMNDSVKPSPTPSLQEFLTALARPGEHLNINRTECGRQSSTVIREDRGGRFLYRKTRVQPDVLCIPLILP
jgi:hypothetical protein